MSRRSQRRRRHARDAVNDSRPGASSLSRLTTLTVRLPRPIQSLRHAAPLDLRHVEDRRRYHPSKILRSPKRVDGSRAMVGVSRGGAKAARHALPHKINFLVPKATVVCIRRKRRKEVLFAKRKTGKRGQRRPRRNFFSEVRC